MRLLFINRFFYPDQSATAQLLTDLATGLAAQGVGVTVITGRVGYLEGMPALPPEDSCKGVKVRRVWSTNFGRRSGRLRLFDYLSFYLAAGRQALGLKQVDTVVVLSDPPMLSILAALLKRLKGWKTVCWLQDVFPEIAVRAWLLRDGPVARALARAVQWSLRQSDRIVVLGRCMERHLLRGGLPRERITIIPNWADGDCLTPVAPGDNWFRKEHGLEGRIVVMYSGNLGVVHETESLIHIISRLRALPDACVLFVGEGKGKDRVEAWVLREGMTHVRFAGYQAQEHLRYSLSAGDIHLVTLRSDMAGLSVPSKVYGIMAVGRPVIFIGPDDSEVAVLVREAACGEIFAPADSERAALAILDLARDRARRERLGASGRRYFEACLDKRFALQRFRAVFQEVVN